MMTPTAAPATPSVPVLSSEEEDLLQQRIAELDERVKRIHDALPVNGMLIVLTSRGHLRTLYAYVQILLN